MTDKLDFSLPQGRQQRPWGPRLVIPLLLVLLGAVVFNLMLSFHRDQGPGNSPTSVNILSAEQARELATRLSQRQLYDQAADVWKEYLVTAPLASAERAQALFQIGVNLKNAERYGDAIEYLYRSEMTARVDSISPEISRDIKDCLEQMGKFSALRYELLDRTRYKGVQDAGAEVLAEIGPEKITDADLSARIEQAIDNQLAPMTAFMTTEQIHEQKKRILEQYKSPQSRQQFLQSWLAEEVLYREALEQGLTEQDQVRRILDDMTRRVLAQQLMNNQLASRIHITEGDLQTYYEAHKSTYMEPPQAVMQHILVADEQAANNIRKRLADGEDFDALAKELSLDESTRDKGGRLDTEVRKDGVIPGMGNVPDLHKAVLAASPPALLESAFHTDKGWEVVKVRSIRPERQKGFDEARQDVMMSLTDQKQQEVQQEMIEQMKSKYDVIIHTSAFAKPDQDAPAGNAP